MGGISAARMPSSSVRPRGPASRKASRMRSRSRGAWGAMRRAAARLLGDSTIAGGSAIPDRCECSQGKSEPWATTSLRRERTIGGQNVSTAIARFTSAAPCLPPQPAGNYAATGSPMIRRTVEAFHLRRVPTLTSGRGIAPEETRRLSVRSEMFRSVRSSAPVTRGSRPSRSTWAFVVSMCSASAGGGGQQVPLPCIPAIPDPAKCWGHSRWASSQR